VREPCLSHYSHCWIPLQQRASPNTEGVFAAGGGPRVRHKSSGVGCPCPRLGSGEARSCSLSGPNPDLIVPIRPLQLCADGGYQLRLGALRVPLIMVPDTRLSNEAGHSSGSVPMYARARRIPSGLCTKVFATKGTSTYSAQCDCH
jgi:hypothetical protein